MHSRWLPSSVIGSAALGWSAMVQAAPPTFDFGVLGAGGGSVSNTDAIGPSATFTSGGFSVVAKAYHAASSPGIAVSLTQRTLA